MLSVLKVEATKHQAPPSKWPKLELIFQLRIIKIKNVKIDIGQQFITLALHKMELLFRIHVKKIKGSQKLLDQATIKYLNVGILLCLSSIQEIKQLFTALGIWFMEPRIKFLLWGRKYLLIHQLILKLKFQTVILFHQKHQKINNLKLQL